MVNFMSIYIIAGIIAVLGMIVQWQLQNRFNRYSKIPVSFRVSVSVCPKEDAL